MMSTNFDSDAYSAFGLRVALGRPEQCHEEVSRHGQVEPCNKVAVALRVDHQEDLPYPVCARHSRGDLVPLEYIVRFMLDRHEAQAVAARGLARIAMASAGDNQ
jgi:hypothetical protein